MRPLALVPLLLACTAVVPARAQMDSREGIQLQNQILELRRDIQLMQQRGPDYGSRQPGPSYGGGQSGDNGLQAQLLDRVQTLEEQVRRLRGQLDEQANTSRVAQERLSKQIDDLNFKLGNAPAARQGTTSPPPSQLSSTSSPGTPTTPTTPTTPSTPDASSRRTPEITLQEGNAALARRDYPAAESAAREIISTNRNSPRIGDANFLLAQSLMGQRNFQGAAVAYDDAYNRNKKGGRAPDALLGLANALTGLNEHPAACATLDKLRREFPDARGPVRDTSSQLRSRNACS